MRRLLRMCSLLEPVGILLSLLCLSGVSCLDNGLARTPPMGWLSWERFGCNTACEQDPDSCIGERLLMLQADYMASEGYKDVGYQYITVDDCWPAHDRDAQGRLQPDPKRFPHGMKALADYIHSKGLKLGIYEDVGRHTCAGAPGTQDHYELDAQTFADWGIDMLKFDGCNTDMDGLNKGYPEMGHYLNKTGRPILYYCEWPVYVRAKGGKPDYTAVAKTCNAWRVYGDIYDAYQSIMSVVNYFGDDSGNFSGVAGPGNFNDGDMITLGNYGLSHEEERLQMGMWAMFASGLLMSVDLRTVPPQSKALLQNKRVLSINQDPLGIPGKRVLELHGKSLQVWTRPVVPEGSFAIAIIYPNNYGGYPTLVKVTLKDMGLTHAAGYNITEVFDGGFVNMLKPDQMIICRVNPMGIVLYRATRM